MSATLRTIKATVDRDGIVSLNEPITLSGPVEAVVTLLIDDGVDAGPSQEEVDSATAKVFEKHDELFRKLAQ